MHAAMLGRFELVEMLVTRGADINLQDEVWDIYFPSENQYASITHTCFHALIWQCGETALTRALLPVEHDEEGVKIAHFLIDIGADLSVGIQVY